MVTMYRKKPVCVLALQWNGSNLSEVNEFLNNENYVIEKDELYIDTLEGRMKVSKNDYIIEGISGEFYPCKPDIFEKTYELVEE